jgi:single-strand DNA-binding protein
MAKSVNKVILVGRLGRDPELKYTASGTPFCRFSMATDDSWNDKGTGERQERTEWHNIVAWDRLAEICNQYLTKGRLVYIEGALQTREWDDQEGNKRKTTEIRARDMVLLGGQGDGAGGNSGQRRATTAEAQASMPGGGGTSTITDDDIPF